MTDEMERLAGVVRELRDQGSSVPAVRDTAISLIYELAADNERLKDAAADDSMMLHALNVENERLKEHNARQAETLGLSLKNEQDLERRIAELEAWRERAINFIPALEVMCDD